MGNLPDPVTVTLTRGAAVGALDDLEADPHFSVRWPSVVLALRAALDTDPPVIEWTPGQSQRVLTGPDTPTPVELPEGFGQAVLLASGEGAVIVGPDDVSYSGLPCTCGCRRR